MRQTWYNRWPVSYNNKDDIMCYSMKVQKEVCGGCSFICFWALPAASLCQRSCRTLTDWNFDGKHCWGTASGKKQNWN
jgi:hypothetical protein